MTQSGLSQALVWGTALVIILGAAVLAGRATPAPRPIAAATSPRDPDLARCRAAGQAALQDPDCRRTWDVARARFFGRAGS